jgi:uncharacterized coiled-coil protein SlyX
MEERFLVLETKAAYHEKEIADLGSVIYKQQQAIDALERQLRKISEQLSGGGGEGDPSEHQPPPHY